MAREPKAAAGQRVRVAVLGYGYWGPNLARNFHELDGCELCTICDADEGRLRDAKKRYPGVRVEHDVREVLKGRDVDAVAIATPASSHFALALEALRSAKHVFVEKPLALRSEDCSELISEAERAGLILMVGHTFLYNPAVVKLKQYVSDGTLGKVYYCYSQRLNLGRVRKDIDAMWNFAPHDVSILLYLLETDPLAVSARAFSFLQNGVTDVAFLTLAFPGGVDAHIHVSWLDPNKVRKMTVVGNRAMIVYDDVSSDEKLTIYDKGISMVNQQDPHGPFDDFSQFQFLHRSGDVRIPKVDFVEPIRVQLAEFLESVRSGVSPLSSGKFGLRVVRVLEAADKSIAAGGAQVPLG